jgi:hypothetical protein
MKRSLMMGGITVAVIGAMSYGLIQWNTVENRKQDALCSEAKQALKGVEIRARALAAGLSVEEYAKDEEAKVAALIDALNTATNEAEVNRVIEAHAAAIEAQAAAIDAEINARGEQIFLDQRPMKRRIPVDVKQELQRAANAVSVACS